MTPKELIEIITQGETETVEFKQSFSKSVIETLVAFSMLKLTYIRQRSLNN